MPGGKEAEQSSDISSATSGALFALPPSAPLDIHDSNVAEKWKEFEQAWRNYSVAMKLHQESDAVQIVTLMIGAEARKVFSMFTFDVDNRRRTACVGEFCCLLPAAEEHTSFTLGSNKWENRMTIIGQALQQLADRCEFETTTAD